MILFLSFHSQVKLFYRLRKLQKRLLTELLIFCSNFVLSPFVLLWFFSNLILIFCLLCNEYALFIMLCMFNFQIFFFFFWVGSIMVLWWDLSFVVIGFVMVWCVVESINQTHQPSVLCHLIANVRFGFNHLYYAFWV